MSGGRRPFKVLFSRAAWTELRSLSYQPRRRLEQRLSSLAFHQPRVGLVAVADGLYLAACESWPEREILGVYAVRPRRELFDRLLGEEVGRAVHRRSSRRLRHGRELYFGMRYAC